LTRHQQHITWLGLLTDRRRLADFYALCDVLALPSRSDCFALVQAEAMLCGTPVVASDIPGAREAGRRSGMGRLAGASNPKALAAALVEVVREPAAYRQPTANIAALFDPAVTIAAYENLLGELIGAPRATPRSNTAVCARRAEDRFTAPDRGRLLRML